MMKFAFTLFLANLALAVSQELDLIELGEAAGVFTILLFGIEAAGLTDALRAPNGPYTLLAPNDDAFATLPEALLDCLIKPENKDVLTDILTYHVTEGVITSANVSDGFTQTMLNGDEIAFTVDSEGNVLVNGIGFVDYDVEASNGIVHVLEGVLVPPGTDIAAFLESCHSDEVAPDLIELAEAAGDFTTLLAGIEAAGLTDALRAPNGPYTLLAPNDEAFEALPEGLLECLIKPENKDVLTDILTYHVTEGVFTSANVSDGFTQTMLNGDEIAFTVGSEGDVLVNGIGFVEYDVEASNGVAHVLEGVLVPPGTDVAAFLESCLPVEAPSGKKAKKDKKGKAQKQKSGKRGGRRG